MVQMRVRYQVEEEWYNIIEGDWWKDKETRNKKVNGEECSKATKRRMLQDKLWMDLQE